MKISLFIHGLIETINMEITQNEHIEFVGETGIRSYLLEPTRLSSEADPGRLLHPHQRLLLLQLPPA